MQLPSAWAPLVEDKSTLDNLFNIIKIALTWMQASSSNGSSSFAGGIQNHYKQMKSLTLVAFRCLSEYANVRATLFSSEAAKSGFVHNFTSNLMQVLENPQVGGPELAPGCLAPTTPIHAIIFQNISLFRETLRMLHKFQNNFGSRTLINTKVEGLLDGYLRTLFQYSVECLQCTLPNK